jgi:hypothetical protein
MIMHTRYASQLGLANVLSDRSALDPDRYSYEVLEAQYEIQQSFFCRMVPPSRPARDQFTNRSLRAKR